MTDYIVDRDVKHQQQHSKPNNYKDYESFTTAFVNHHNDIIFSQLIQHFFSCEHQYFFKLFGYESAAIKEGLDGV